MQMWVQRISEEVKIQNKKQARQVGQKWENAENDNDRKEEEEEAHFTFYNNLIQAVYETM